MLRANCSALKSQPSAPDFVQRDFESFVGRYQAVQQDLEERHQQLENGRPILLRFFIRQVRHLLSQFALA